MSIPVLITRPLLPPGVSPWSTPLSIYAAYLFQGTPLDRENLIGLVPVGHLHFRYGIKEKIGLQQYHYAIFDIMGANGFIDFCLANTVSPLALLEIATDGKITTQQAVDTAFRMTPTEASELVTVYINTGVIVAQGLMPSKPVQGCHRGRQTTRTSNDCTASRCI